MNQSDRTQNSAANIRMAMLYHGITLTLNLISKRAILSVMGAEYLGVQGLFSNIFNLLSFADLGLQAVMCVTMYQPLAENDEKQIQKLYQMFKKGFGILAAITAVIGLLCIFLLEHVVNSQVPIEEIIIYYLFYLSATVVNNCFRMQINMFIADQKKRVVNAVTTIFDGLSLVGGIVVLYTTHSYLIFSVVLLVRAVLYNLYLYFRVYKEYPYLKRENLKKQKASKQEWKRLLTDFYDVVVYKLTAALLNSTDNLFISRLIGTVYVGICSNYQLIILGVSEIVRELFDSIAASVGNFMTLEKDKGELKRIFSAIVTAANWGIGVTTVCLWVLLPDFVRICFGEEVILPEQGFILMLVNYFLTTSMFPVTMLRENAGIFREAKWASVIRALLNIVLSAILGMIWGLNGILGATGISILVTTFWYEPYLIYKKMIDGGGGYIWKKLESVLSVFIGCVLIRICLGRICADGLSWFLVKAVVCGMISVIYFSMFVLLHAKDRAYIMKILKKILPLERIKKWSL